MKTEEGTGRKRRTRKRWLLTGLAVCATFLASASVADRSFPPDYGRAQSFALLLYDRRQVLLDGHTSRDGMWRLPASAAQIDPAYLALLFKTEDRRFSDHPGVDGAALLRAAWQLAKRGHIVSGGSTLAMQTARLLSPHPHTLAGKLEDILRALQLEFRLGRRGVLDLYLTLAPEGGNIEGIRAASLLYFGHEPNRLSPAEAAFLVVLPRRPSAWRPDRHPRALENAARQILAHAGSNSLAESVPEAPRFPVMPHEAPALRGVFQARKLTGVRTVTLDGALQRRARQILAQREPPLRGTFAALITDRKNRVLVWIGSSRASCPACENDMVRAVRSPGSTLKPFIYGMAFEDGSLTPETLVPDKRMSVGGYAPHDFGRAFSGETTVAQALQRSLNVPAVLALQDVGPSRFTARLKQAGVSLRLPRNRNRNGETSKGEVAPNLALALGGAGSCLEDLTRLYGALENGGRVFPLQILAAPPSPPAGPRQPLEARKSKGEKLLTPRAARQVRRILEGARPPPGTSAWAGVAFKTGTSYGNRDAWAMAAFPEGVAGVWAGRPDGTASPGITGRVTAGPVLAALVSLVHASGGSAESGGSMSGRPHTKNQAVLSPSLRRRPVAHGPQIVYPQPHAQIESSTAQSFSGQSFSGQNSAGNAQPVMTPVGLEAAGGTPPYHWFVDGVPLETSSSDRMARTPVWTPSTPGFVHLTVVDAAGRPASVDVRIR